MIIRRLSQVHRIPRILFPRTAPVTQEACIRREFWFHLPLAVQHTFFHSKVSKYLPTISKRTSHFDAIPPRTEALVLKYGQFLFDCQLSTFVNNVNCSNWLYLVASPTNSDDDNNNNKNNRTDSNTQYRDLSNVGRILLSAIHPEVYWLGRCVVMRKVTGLLSLLH